MISGRPSSYLIYCSKVDDSEVVNFLLQTEIIPLCLRIMETGSELSKTVATFIVQKILLDEMGLSYICASAERFYAVSTFVGFLIWNNYKSGEHCVVGYGRETPRALLCPSPQTHRPLLLAHV